MFACILFRPILRTKIIYSQIYFYHGLVSNDNNESKNNYKSRSVLLEQNDGEHFSTANIFG